MSNLNRRELLAGSALLALGGCGGGGSAAPAPSPAPAPAPTPAPAAAVSFANVSVHDPSVIRTGGGIYVFGSHLAAARTTDLMNWTKLADGVEPSSAARILVCFVEGLRVVGKTAPTRIISQATVDAFLERFIR